MSQRILDFLRPDAETYGPPEVPGDELEAVIREGVAAGMAPGAVQTGARPWTPAELLRWTDAVNSKGVIPRGMRESIEAEAAKKGTCDVKPLWPEELELFFEDPVAKLFGEWIRDEGMEPALNTRDALAWFESKLSAAKLKAAEYPLKVARKRGALTLKAAPQLYVGTIHSFKGAEADVVIILPDISPAGWAEWNGRKAQKDSVVRAFYVALTRAKERVLLGQPYTRMSVPLGDCVNL